MNDELLKLFAASVSGAGVVAQQAGRFLGRNRTYFAVARVGGDVTGTGPILNFELQESATVAGTYTTVPGTVTANPIAEMWGSYASNPAKPELPRASGPTRVPFTTTKDFVRAVVTAGGTTPVFPTVSIYAEPLDTTSKISGS